MENEFLVRLECGLVIGPVVQVPLLIGHAGKPGYVLKGGFGLFNPTDFTNDPTRWLLDGTHVCRTPGLSIVEYMRLGEISQEWKRIGAPQQQKANG